MLDRTELKKEVEKYLVLMTDFTEFKETDSIKFDWELDSLDLYDLIRHIETTFKVDYDYEDFKDADTYGKVLDILLNPKSYYE